MSRQVLFLITYGKEYLIELRLAPLIRKEGHQTQGEYLGSLQRSSFDEPHRRLVHAMTTNETLFFRDLRPFDLLRSKVLRHKYASATLRPGRETVFHLPESGLPINHSANLNRHPHFVRNLLRRFVHIESFRARQNLNYRVAGERMNGKDSFGNGR